MAWNLSPETRAKLRSCLEQGQRCADSSECEQLVALRVAVPAEQASDPLALFQSGAGSERFFWEHPSESHSMAALGVVRDIETGGSGRFIEAERRGLALLRQLLVGGDRAEPGAGPLLVGGFAFTDVDSSGPEWRSFPAGRLVLPEILLVHRADCSWLTVCGTVAPGADAGASSSAFVGALERALSAQRCDIGSEGSALHTDFPALGPDGLRPGPEYCVKADRSHADYCAQVAAAVDSIAAGELEKVVLARSLSVRHDGRFELVRFLDRLRNIYPSCVSFALSRNGDAFVGATPEGLVAVEGDRVTACALAGSAPRGRTPEEDEALGRGLCESKKDQEEHAVVVRAIRRHLEPLCDELQSAEAPELMRVEGIAHLRTIISGRLRDRPPERPSLLELVAALHPTPAVGGAPRRRAIEWIERFEGMDRGWYAGPVGWLDARGGGQFQVALRSGLILGGDQGDRARLFAGAGIVAGSDPESELRETRLKLRALLAPLTEI